MRWRPPWLASSPVRLALEASRQPGWAMTRHAPRPNSAISSSDKRLLLQDQGRDWRGDRRAELAELSAQRQRWNEAGSPKDRLCACVQDVFENKDFLAQRGCAVGTFCSELHKAGGSVATRATEIFAQHLAWIESQFRALGKGKDSNDLAVHLLSALQGVSILAHSFHDAGLVATETKRLKSWIQSL